MNKSDIEWTEFTSNPVKGKCPVDCSYCYVKPLRHRYGWHDDIIFYPKELEAIRRRKKPAKIFVGSTIELFHEQTIQYMPEIMETVRGCPQHTFMFLTKQPQNLSKFNPFPDNCWVGVTATNTAMLIKAGYSLEGIEAKIKFISLEPFLAWDHGTTGFIASMLTKWGISWEICGAQTKPTVMPRIEWVEEIVRAADKAGVKVFLKNNLKPLLRNNDGWTPAIFVSARDSNSNEWLRQEMPA